MDQTRLLKLLSSPQLAWIVALTACAVAAWGWLRDVEAPPAVEHADKSAKTVAQASAEPVHSEEILARGDGMYVSPTDGPPLDLKYLARGTQGVIALRPAELLRHPEGCQLLEPDISGNFARWMRYILPQVSGSTLGNIELLLIGWNPNTSAHCKILYFRDPVPIAELFAKMEWHAWTDEIEGQTVLRDSNRGTYWQPPGENRRVLVITTFEALSAIIHGAPADLPPATLALLKHSDARRHFTIAGAPYVVLQNSGLFSQTANLLLNPVAWFLTGFEGDLPGHVPAKQSLNAIPAVLLSGHLDDERSFAELLIAQPDTRADHLVTAQPFQDRVNQFDQLANRYIQKLDQNLQGHNLSLVYPDMVRALRKYTRVGMDEDRIVMRSYLPVQGPRRLLLGARLCLGEHPPAWEQPEPNSLEARLNRLVTLEFEFNTLEKAMQLLSEAIGFPITIREQDLQMAGMEKISLRFHERQAPAREILVKILQQCSPDGKLIYIIKSQPDGGQEIFITTRAAVYKNGEPLPADFGGVTELLNRRATLSPPRNSMDKLLQMLSEKTGIPIAIRDHDLQLEGITKGQSYGVHEVDKPAREILLKILSAFRRDKLVFIIHRKPDDSGEEVIITTRAAVEKNGEQLPPEFEK